MTSHKIEFSFFEEEERERESDRRDGSESRRIEKWILVGTLSENDLRENALRECALRERRYTSTAGSRTRQRKRMAVPTRKMISMRSSNSANFFGLALILLLLTSTLRSVTADRDNPDETRETDLPIGADYGELLAPASEVDFDDTTGAARAPSLPPSLNVGRVVYITTAVRGGWDSDSNTYLRLGVSPSFPQGIAWQLSYLSPKRMVDINVGGPYGNPWGVTHEGLGGTYLGGKTVFKNVLTGQWFYTASKDLPMGILQSVAIGGPYGQIFAVSTSNNVYYRAGASPTSPGFAWVPMISLTHKMSYLSVGGGYGDVFALGIVGSGGQIGGFGRTTGDRFVLQGGYHWHQQDWHKLEAGRLPALLAHQRWWRLRVPKNSRRWKGRHAQRA